MTSTQQKKNTRISVSGTLKDGRLYETVLSKSDSQTKFAIYDGAAKLEDHIELDLHTLIPVSAGNNLLKPGSVVDKVHSIKYTVSNA